MIETAHEDRNDHVKSFSITTKKIIGWLLVGLGCCGLAYFGKPPEYFPLNGFAYWAAGWMCSTIIMFSGFPGIFYDWLTAKHLKIVDLIWIVASAVAVTLAIVQIAELTNSEQRDIFSKNVATSRVKAKIYMDQAYKEQCLNPSLLSETQCEKLRQLAISLHTSEYVSKKVADELCEPPIRLDQPPVAFSSALIEGCLESMYIANVQEEPIMANAYQVDPWKIWMRTWPLWMVLLVGLRTMKSIAEVFWKIH